ELLGLRVELDREPHAMLCRQLADLADALRRPPEVTAPLVDRAHHGATAGRRGPPALFVEHPEQTQALRALGVHPAELDADARDGKAVRRHEREHVGGGLTPLGRPGEVRAAQLDAVPADAPRDAQYLGERGRVERPGGEREHRLLRLPYLGSRLRALERLVQLTLGRPVERARLGAATGEADAGGLG